MQLKVECYSVPIQHTQSLLSPVINKSHFQPRTYPKTHDSYCTIAYCIFHLSLILPIFHSVKFSVPIDVTLSLLLCLHKLYFSLVRKRLLIHSARDKSVPMTPLQTKQCWNQWPVVFGRHALPHHKQENITRHCH